MNNLINSLRTARGTFFEAIPLDVVRVVAMFVVAMPPRGFVKVKSIDWPIINAMTNYAVVRTDKTGELVYNLLTGETTDIDIGPSDLVITYDYVVINTKTLEYYDIKSGDQGTLKVNTKGNAIGECVLAASDDGLPIAYYYYKDHTLNLPSGLESLYMLKRYTNGVIINAEVSREEYERCVLEDRSDHLYTAHGNLIVYRSARDLYMRYRIKHVDHPGYVVCDEMHFCSNGILFRVDKDMSFISDYGVVAAVDAPLGIVHSWGNYLVAGLTLYEMTF